ncbi:MAG: Chromosome partition protein Smc [Anaerolineales bacterium]|nr:Chromosome partition protein Smc [Anaerolineales bacterium]
MIPINLNISGFLSYRERVELDFETFHLACISGQNGAGKSSLLDAITWALFGEARGKDKDSLINLQSEAAEVALTFAYEGNLYRVQRTAPRGKTTVLEFQIADIREPIFDSSENRSSNIELSNTKLSNTELSNPVAWRPLTEKSARETQRRIEQTLRLDYDTFVNASFFLQGKADEFTQKKAGERKTILSSILGLEIWEAYKERAASRRKEIETEMAGIDRSIADIDAELLEEDARKQKLKSLESELKQLAAARKAQESALESIRKAAASLDRELAAEKARLEEERRGLREQSSVISDQSSVISGLMKQIETSRKLLAEAEENLAKRGDTGDRRSAGREEQATLKAENDLRKLEMDELKARIDQLESAEGATCPLCGQELSEAHRKSTLKQLKAEGKENGDRFRANAARMSELAKEITETESQLTKLASAERERLMQSNSVTQLTERIELLKAAEASWLSTGAPRLKEVEAVLSSEKYAAEVKQPSINLEDAERSLLELQEQENKKNQEVGGARQRVEVLDALRARKQSLAAERADRARGVMRHRTLEKAFGKDGVPALLIEQALPQIETKANDLLDRLSAGQMSIRFATQAEYKARNRDDLKETLDILISDGAGLRDYEMFSGGERFRVDFAIRLALSEILTQRKGARLQTLVIDEGFGSQDAQGRQRLIEAINLIKHDFAKILVITHLDELKDAFSTRIEVEKTERGSTVRVI